MENEPKDSNTEPGAENPNRSPEDPGNEHPNGEGPPSEAKGDSGQASERQSAEQELLYLRAEFENYRKRMSREQEKAVKFSNEKIITELLFVIDLLERALGHGTTLKEESEDKNVTALVDGVQMTHHELLQTLGRFGVSFVGQVGEDFNPALHEAISQIEAPEDQTDKLVEVLQKGCLLHGRLLKPAKVVVGKSSS